ncbi:MAG: biliverdin-producing heme oxygenase [Kofleriaceae bacterium]
MSVLERLEAATRARHRDNAAVLEAVFSLNVSLETYRWFLARAYGFELPIDLMVASIQGGFEGSVRSKSILAAGDLVNLGLDLAAVTALPVCRDVPSSADPATAYGWIYVAERSTLVHPLAFRHLLTRLPKQAMFAGTYLTRHAGAVGSQWRLVGEALDRALSTEPAFDAAVAAAEQAFAAERSWFTS